MQEKPLNVRCAEALGWTQRVLPPLGHTPGPVAWRSPDRKVEGAYLPPYGDDTPAGWACTGPLIGRYGLTIYCRRDGFGPMLPGYAAHRPDKSPMDVSPNACAAAAEWVAQNVENGEPRKAHEVLS